MCTTVAPQKCNYVLKSFNASQLYFSILQFPSTSCPGVAGLVSWTAVSSVFICWVKLLPLAVTMVIVPPGSVACRGVRRCSLCWTLWKCMGTTIVWIYKCMQTVDCSIPVIYSFLVGITYIYNDFSKYSISIQLVTIYMAVPGRNWILFCHIFWAYHWVWLAIVLSFHWGWGWYVLHRRIRYSCIYTSPMSMNPALSGSSAQ